MAGHIRVFEHAADGRLVEVAPETRGARLARRVSLEIDVLLTDEEEAERSAEEAAHAAAREARTQERTAALAERAAQGEAAKAKLEAMGLTVGELRALLG